jgi:hypothetical protein
VLPGDMCNHGERCMGMSECRDGFCACIGTRIVRNRECIFSSKGGLCISFVQQWIFSIQFDPVRCVMTATCVLACLDARIRYAPAPTIILFVMTNAPNDYMVTILLCMQMLLFLVRPGFLCNMDDICIGMSQCIDGLCMCSSGYLAIDDQCIRGGKTCNNH